MTRSPRRALSALTAVALLAGLFIGAPAPVRAAQTYYVGHLVNDYAPGSECANPDYWTDGDWPVDGGPYNSNNDAIQDAADHAASGSVIYICAGTYMFAEEVTVGAGKSLTFRGEGEETVLDGNDITRIFNASPVNENDQGGALSLRDLLIMDAQVPGPNAGAIVADGLSLDSVTITRSEGAYNGGALYAEGNVTIVDSTFTDNVASADGGVLYAWNGASTVTISNSMFDINRAGGGGGAIVGATVTVVHSIFTGNSSSYGGAIYATETATVTNSTFTNNSSNAGGAIDANSTATVTNSNFTNNSAYMGGAIYGNSTTVTRSTFTSNSAVLGGAIGSAIVSAAANTFTENEASILGGAIFAWNSATLTSSTFANNDAGSYGGALHASTATIARSRFTLNSAGEHGGAVNLYGPTRQDLRKWRRNTFSRNTAPLGGAVTLGSCEAPSRSEAARVERANRFSGNRATEQRRTNNIERREGGCV